MAIREGKWEPFSSGHVWNLKWRVRKINQRFHLGTSEVEENE